MSVILLLLYFSICPKMFEISLNIQWKNTYAIRIMNLTDNNFVGLSFLSTHCFSWRMRWFSALCVGVAGSWLLLVYGPGLVLWNVKCFVVPTLLRLLFSPLGLYRHDAVHIRRSLCAPHQPPHDCAAKDQGSDINHIHNKCFSVYKYTNSDKQVTIFYCFYIITQPEVIHDNRAWESIEWIKIYLKL